MNRITRRRAHGFTLVEILVAMAIFGMVIAAIYATWTAILKASKIGLAASAQVQRERISIHKIEEALMSVRSFAGDVQHYGFVVENGEEATISFVARLPRSFPRSGKFGDFDVRRVTFSVEGSSYGGNRELVLRQNPILMDLDEDEKEHPLVLSKGVDKLEFEFWDARINDWVDTWTQTNQLPKLVKVTLSFTKPNEHYSYAQNKEEVTRIIALPSITVPQNWQTPAGQGRPPPGPTPVPGQPPIQTPGQIRPP